MMKIIDQMSSIIDSMILVHVLSFMMQNFILLLDCNSLNSSCNEIVFKVFCQNKFGILVSENQQFESSIAFLTKVVTSFLINLTLGYLYL